MGVLVSYIERAEMSQSENKGSMEQGGFPYRSFEPSVAVLTWPYEINNPDREVLIYPVLATSKKVADLGGFGLWCEATPERGGSDEYSKLWGFYGRLTPMMSWQAAWFLERILSNSTSRPSYIIVEDLIDATWRAFDDEYTPQVRSILAHSADVTPGYVDSSLNEALRQYPSPSIVSLMMERVNESQRDELRRELRYALEDRAYSTRDSEALSIDFGIPLLAGAI